MPDLAGRSIAITGASSGIGAATARAAAAAGMDVVLMARRVDRLRSVADDVEAAGRIAVCVEADVTDPASDARLLAAAGGLEAPLHAVFANAGYGLDADLLDCTDQQIRDIFETNVFAADRLLRNAARHLQAAGTGGHLLSCCSCVSRFSLPGSAAYAATKAAQAHLATGLRIELHGTGVYVSSVHPVTTRTEFFDVAADEGGKSESRLASNVAARFSQPPERVAHAVIRCLRRPRPEVWTSFPTRAGAALMVLAPRLADTLLRRAMPR